MMAPTRVIIAIAWLGNNCSYVHGLAHFTLNRFAINIAARPSLKFVRSRNKRCSKQSSANYDRNRFDSFLKTKLNDEDGKLEENHSRQAGNGNYLELLALSVSAFFLATVLLTNGQIFSDFSNFESQGGKASFYKSVDADAVLQQDFNRESSSVIF